MKIQNKEYRTIWYEENVVKIIDQTKLPHQFIIKDLKTVKDSINSSELFLIKSGSLFSLIASAIPYAAVPPIKGAPLTSITLMALITSLTVFKSLIIN